MISPVFSILYLGKFRGNLRLRRGASRVRPRPPARSGESSLAAPLRTARCLILSGQIFFDGAGSNPKFSGLAFPCSLGRISFFSKTPQFMERQAIVKGFIKRNREMQPLDFRFSLRTSLRSRPRSTGSSKVSPKSTFGQLRILKRARI